jgi:hypothetical protein
MPPWPNPGNGEARLRFALPRPGVVRLGIHDLQGRRVASIADAPFAAGWHDIEWRPEKGRGGDLAAGLYVLRLEAGSETRARKLVIVR